MCWQMQIGALHDYFIILCFSESTAHYTAACFGAAVASLPPSLYIIYCIFNIARFFEANSLTAPASLPERLHG